MAGANSFPMHFRLSTHTSYHGLYRHSKPTYKSFPVEPKNLLTLEDDNQSITRSQIEIGNCST